MRFQSGTSRSALTTTRSILRLATAAVALGALAPTALLAHGGHGATPAHVHLDVTALPPFAIDVGAAVVALLVGAALLRAARRRAQRDGR